MMYICPICHKESDTVICSCGYDRSRDYCALPCLFPLEKDELIPADADSYYLRSAVSQLQGALESLQKLKGGKKPELLLAPECIRAVDALRRLYGLPQPSPEKRRDSGEQKKITKKGGLYIGV